jgi:glycosyltransferase involved in cell wall biosynthesis
VPVNREGSTKLLPIAIMAHNEEKVIQKAVESILSQNTPAEYSVKAIAVANACTDRTEEVVNRMVEQYPDRIQLVSIREKGKTKAINEAIKLFDKISNGGFKIPYVIFLDADCEFNDKEVLLNFVKRFEQNPQLCAVGANCLPDVLFNSRKDIVAQIYRTIYSFGSSLRNNSISGMCYAIRLDILKKIDFPEFQFAEDMYLSSRLDGHFLKDRNIKIVFKTPSNLGDETNRRTRHVILTRLYHDYYSFLRKKGTNVKLFEKSLGDDYRWWGAPANNMIIPWLRLKGIKTKLLVIAYVLVRLWAKIKAYRLLKKVRRDESLDYWKVTR